MEKLKFKSLAMRIWTTITAVIVTVVFLASIIYVAVIREYQENQLFKYLEIAQEISYTGKVDKEILENLDAGKYFKSMYHFPLNLRNGKIILEKDLDPKNKPKLNLNEVKKNRELARAIKDDLNEEDLKLKLHGKEYLVHVKFREDIKGIKRYSVSYMLKPRETNQLERLFFGAIVFIIGGFVVAKLIAYKIAKPLKELEGYTKEIAKKNWNATYETNRRDEIGSLAHSMNEMKHELKRAEEEEKMFLQSISHDLKTPVMVIMSYAQAILDGMHVGSLKDTAGTILEESSRLESKIKKLLYLSSLEYAMDKEDTELHEIDLDWVLERLVDKFKAVGREDINWNVDLSEISLRIDEERINVALENIFDNQLRYAKDNIWVSLKEENKRAIIEIENNGEKMSENSLKNIFDRFYKEKKGKFGLGLAITKKVVDKYGGEIEAQNTSRGVKFKIELPIR